MELPKDHQHYVLLKEEAWEALEAASLKKGQKPATRPSSKELIGLRDQIVSRYTRSSRASGVWISYITHKYHPSIAPISTLTQVYTGDLCLETNHRGSYIILRTVTPLNKVGVILGVVEDENGGCELIQLPVLNASKDRYPKRIFTKGQVFIVKEPFYKSNESGEIETGTSICVDHISDIIFLDPDDIRVPQKWRAPRQGADKTAVIWKDEGNAFYKSGKIYEAIECYTKGLKAAIGGDDTEIIKNLRLNRSQAFLRISGSIPYYDKALEDANYVLELDPVNEKALYRAARALYLSRKFGDSKDLLAKLLKRYKNKDAEDDLLKVSRRLKEEKDGNYDFKELIRLTSNVERSNGPVKLDYADFVGPICLQDTKNSGKGLFTTRDVSFGELLIFTKSFYIDCPQTNDLSININLTKGKGRIFSSDGRDHSVQNIVQILYNNPSMINEFLKLYCGGYGESYEGQKLEEKYVDGEPIIDTFLVYEILSHNVHQVTLLNTPAYYIKMRDSGLGGMPKVDMGKGIGVLSSFINHACWSQGAVRRSIIGDIVIIRAAMDIKKGQELTLSYHPGQDLDARQQSLTGTYGFTCTCDLCKLESEEPLTIRNARALTLEEILSFKPTSPEHTHPEKLKSALPEVLELVNSLKLTYKNPPSEQPRLVLVNALELQLYLCSFMARFIPSQDLLNCIITTVKDTFVALGYEIKESKTLKKVIVMHHGNFPDHVSLSSHAVECSLAYSMCGNDSLARAWQEFAVDLYEVNLGERVTFSERFRDSFAGVGYELK